MQNHTESAKGRYSNDVKRVVVLECPRNVAYNRIKSYFDSKRRSDRERK